MSTNLTDKDHDKMDRFLGDVFDAIKSGRVERAKFIEGMAHVMAALDIDNYDEAVSWFESGASGLNEGKPLA